MVTEQTGASLLAPRVKVFFSIRAQAHIPPEVVDLSRPGVKDKIVSREDAAAWGLKNVEQLWAP
ncbi:hypothetical protein [Sulfuritalea sp.]|uniref:hypothetical protein n=1 Tax=Sulfuritalea sp. TaxID=2480090 RepID=UPI00343F4040